MNNHMERFRSDLVDAFRELRTGTLTVAAAVITLAAAIGMNLAMFGLIDRALISPPKQVVKPDRLFRLSFQAPGEQHGQPGMTTTSYVTYRQIRDHVSSLSGIAVWKPGPTSVVIDGEQTRADTLLVSGTYFDVLGATARSGRRLNPADETNGQAIAVVSDAFWHRAFRSDPDILNRRVVADGVDYVVAGVMPRGFSGHSASSVDVWLPLSTAMRGDPGWSENPFRNVVSVFGRVSDSSTPAIVAQQATAVLNREVALQTSIGVGVGSTERRIALWLSAVSVLVLAIGLANAATLLLVRATRRRRESAIKGALGATRGRLLGQVGIQAIVIAVLAVAAAVVLGQWLDDALRTVLLPGLIENDAIESRTLLAALAAGIVAAAVAFGAGAWALPSGLRGDDLHAGDQRGRVRVQSVLLCVQTTVCVLLLAGTGMFGRSLYRLVQQDFGMHMDHVLLVEFEQGGGPDADRGSIFTEALTRIRALPGVASATTFQTLPFGAHHIPPISVPGRSEPPNVGGQLPFLIAATPEFFDILGIEIVQGRTFTDDDERGEPVVVVNQTMARGVWPNENAVGKCIRIGFDPSFDPFTAAGPPTPSATVPCRRIVGVARDVRQRSVVPSDNEAHLMQYYVPTTQVPGPPAGMGAMPQASGLLVRTVDDPARSIDAIRRLVINGRGTLPFVEVERYTQSLERQVRPWRMGISLLGMFSILAIGVAGIGLYAAFAHAIAQRSREMAIRVAIGASPIAVMSMVVTEAARLAAIGIGAGAFGAILGGRTLESVLYGFVAADPLVLASAAITMLLIVVVATSIPAIRASRVDPNAVLRAE